MVTRNYNIVADTIDKVKKHFPDVYNIYVKVQANKNSFTRKFFPYRSTIELRMNRKRFVASKYAHSYRQALMKAEDAILKQLTREKGKRTLHFSSPLIRMESSYGHEFN